MNRPRDWHVADRVGPVRLARLFSNVVSPPVMFAILGFAVAWHDLPFWEGLAWGTAYGLLVSLAPIIFVLYQLKTGRISDLHMSTLKERNAPYLIGAIFAFLAFGVLTAYGAPLNLRCLAIFNGIELTTLGLINLWWLISMHATGITATTMIVGLLFGLGPALFLAPLVLLVDWVRLYLKRHTLAQLVAGTALGIISVLAMSSTGCFGGL